MEEKLKTALRMRPYLQRGLIVFAGLVVFGGGVLTWKGPALVKNMAKASLERSLAPLGIDQVEIDSVNFGWWRVYLTDIHTKASSSAPSLSIEEMDVALSLFFKMKAIDVVGATLELKEGDKVSFSKDDWQGKVAHLRKAISHINRLKLPAIALRDCLLVIPGTQGLLKIPVHATTETTVTRNQLLTIDWGELAENKFSGQFVLELGRKGVTLDLHTTNINIQTPFFQIKAPEISLWGSTASEGGEGYKIDGFAKLDRLMLASYGSLKAPLEVNVEGVGTPDNLVLDELTITTNGRDVNLLELEGNFNPSQSSAQMVLTAQISQLSKLWDFTPLLATHAKDKVAVEGKVNLAGEVVWEKGHLTTSALALDIRGLTVTREGFSIEGANSKLIFSTLKPLTTQGLQRASATKLSMAGIDLKKVRIEGLVDAKGVWQIQQFTAKTLGGTLKAHSFQRDVNTPSPAFQFEADFKNIELADILKLTDLRSLSGHAKLAGSASMRYGLEDGLDVVQAELHSVSDSGHIQYKPQQGEGGGAPFDQKEVNMAFQVLDDLNFTLFNVRLEHAPNNPSEMQGIVKMLGSNPKVLNGYPFEFNIVTTGKLKDLVVNTLQHMKPVADLTELNKAVKATKEAKAAKAAQSPESPKPKVAKTTKATKIIKSTKRAKAVKSRKRARVAKAIKSTKRVKQNNRKLKNG